MTATSIRSGWRRCPADWGWDCRCAAASPRATAAAWYWTLALPDEMAEDTVEDVQFDYAGGFQPALVGLADALPYQAFLQKHSDD